MENYLKEMLTLPQLIPYHSQTEMKPKDCASYQEENSLTAWKTTSLQPNTHIAQEVEKSDSFHSKPPQPGHAPCARRGWDRTTRGRSGSAGPAGNQSAGLGPGAPRGRRARQLSSREARRARAHGGPDAGRARCPPARGFGARGHL